MDFITKLTNKISTFDPCSQIGIGAASGFLAGFILMKIGKIAAVIFGGALLLIEFGYAKGLIQIDWHRIAENIERYKEQSPNTITLVNMEKIPKNVRYFVVAFLGGSLIGLGST